MKTALSPIQTEIYKAITQMAERSSFTEYDVAKKIRQNVKLDGKKKAGIALADFSAALEAAAEDSIFFSIHINSANDILLKKEQMQTELPLEAKHRRQASEKSMSILVNGDLKQTTGNSKKLPAKKRSERKSLNINQNWDSFDD